MRHTVLWTGVATCLALLAGLAFGRPVGASMHDADEANEPVPMATPNCPGSGGVGPQAPCTALKIHGNTFQDVNHDGRYETNRGDFRLPGIEVVLRDAATGFPLGSAQTNADGYYRFPDLPIGPVYRIEVILPPDMRATTPTWQEFELRDFSTFWCCSARADFGMLPAHVVPTPPLPGPGQPIPPPCCEIPTARQVHLPILNYAGNANVCASIVEAQNIGAWPSKALLVLWGAPGFCPPQCSGPLKVECSGLLAPGSAWNFLGAQLPNGAKSGMVFSAPAISQPDGGDVFADRLCEALHHAVVGNCDEFRRFKKAFNELGTWVSQYGPFDFHEFPGAALAVEVVRKCPGDIDPAVTVTGGYAGLADEMLGAYDPVYGGYTFFAPLVVAGENGMNSWLYVQNGGIECSSVEIWFKGQNDCLRPVICDVTSLAPGETYQMDASSCVGPDWVGNAWIRGSQPMSVVVDSAGRDVLTSYQASPGELRYSFFGGPYFTAGSPVLFGALLYSEYQGWDATVQVQNLSGTNNARVKVYFLDRSGGVVATVIDWICPSGSQAFNLPVISALPGAWVGSVRVESQDWFVPGNPAVPATNIAGVVHMIKYADPTRAQPLEAVAYSLLSEQRAVDWQLGSGRGGLYSGVGRIGIPSFFKDRGSTGLTSEVAIANLVAKPGSTDFAILIYDQNGLIQSLCEKLPAGYVEYIDLAADLAFLPPGFKGSAVISAVEWDHHVFDGEGDYVRSLVGLAAAKIERSGTVNGADVPGDESAAMEGFPMIGPFTFLGPPAVCPGLPDGGAPPGGGPPGATPRFPTAVPTSPATAIPPPPAPPPPP